MKLETKYDIGTHIWYVSKNTKYETLEVFDTYIISIDIGKDGYRYLVDEGNYFDVAEEDIILYEDKDKLYEVIKKLAEELKNE